MHDFLGALQSEFDFKDGNSPYLTSRGKYSGGTWMTPQERSELVMEIIELRMQLQELRAQVSPSKAAQKPKGLLMKLTR